MSSPDQKKIERAFLSWMKEMDGRKKIPLSDAFYAGVAWLSELHKQYLLEILEKGKKADP